MPKTDILVLVFALSVLSDTVTYGLDGNGSSNRICNAVLSFCFVEIVADPDLVLFAKSDFVAMKCEDFSSQTPLFLKAVIILSPGAIASKAPSLLFRIFMNKTLVYCPSVIFEFRVIFFLTSPIKV